MSALDPELIARAGEVVRANAGAGRVIALAESCTGGLVAAAITAVPGSSEVFLGGWVTYANAAKREWLGVGDDVLDTFGAVSEATAWAMARGALARGGADVAVSITGIAGPGGGSTAKPVGTVVFGRALRGSAGECTERRRFEGDRNVVRLQAALFALDLLMPPAP